ncbi:hypothetical protein [Rheinheimera sp.]|uniref:hypothetical protein n=1 Tax=Rheinheimera sp. TaxID=1869214 RepID=UPI00307DA04E
MQDAQYENERLQQVAEESPLLKDLVQSALDEMAEFGDTHTAIWLGSFMEKMPRTQVQLVITQLDDLFIDED